MREPNNRGYNDSAPIRRPASVFRANEHRAERRGRRALDRAVRPLHTPRVFRNTRPVPGYRQETRDRQIAGWKLYNPRTKGMIATIDRRVSLPYIPRVDIASSMDSFLFWVETWNYWKLRSILVKSFKMEGRSLDSFFFLSWNLELLEIKERRSLDSLLIRWREKRIWKFSISHR